MAGPMRGGQTDKNDVDLMVELIEHLVRLQQSLRR
jgi:hypothetical protein